MTNSELQNKLDRLSRAICCNKPKIVTELPIGNKANGFVIFEDELYFWDGDSWELVGGGGVLPIFKTINGETIDNGPGNIVAGGTGLELLGGGIGWRLVGRNPANYGNIGLNAVDFSNSTGASGTRGATGTDAVAWGQNNTASTSQATAWGISTSASGVAATASGTSTSASGTNGSAFGQGSIASGSRSMAWGMSSTASGHTSTAAGRLNTASGYNATCRGDSNIASGITADASGLTNTASGNITKVWGRFNTASAVGSNAWGRGNTSNSFEGTVFGTYATIAAGQNLTTIVSTDELVKIGNGVNTGARSDAFLILKDGTITAPSLDNTKITTAGNKALITKEYLDANAGSSSGLEAIDEGNGFGWRLIGKDPANYGNIGFKAVDLSHSSSTSSTKGATGQNSTCFGVNVTASGVYSFAMGYNTVASGDLSLSFGTLNNTGGSFSTALGRGNNSNANYSVTIGSYNRTYASRSIAMGYGSFAHSFGSLSVGMYCVSDVGQDQSNFVSTDSIFKVGNGTSTGARSDALRILKNAVQIQGGITAADASALTPEPGMQAYVTTTDATFVTTGFWKYQGGAWSPF